MDGDLASEQQLNELRGQLAADIYTAEGRGLAANRSVVWWHLTAAALAAFAAFLVCLFITEEVSGRVFASAAIIVSASITFMTSWEAFLAFRDRSIAAAVAAQTYRLLQCELEFFARTPGGVSRVKLDELAHRHRITKQAGAQA